MCMRTTGSSVQNPDDNKVHVNVCACVQPPHPFNPSDNEVHVNVCACIQPAHPFNPGVNEVSYLRRVSGDLIEPLNENEGIMRALSFAGQSKRRVVNAYE